MEMHQIRYFLAVSDALNFTRAAEECHVAQPSLSRAIGKLEEELGGDLFRRERSQTHLTDLGRHMQPLLRAAYASAVEAKEQAAKYKSAEIAPLRIGLSKSVPIGLLTAILSELESAFPGLELHLTRSEAGEVLDALRAGDIELGVAAETPGADWDRLDRWYLFDEGFVLLGSPKVIDTVSLADAIEQNSLIKRPYCENYPAFEAALSALGVTPENRHEVSDDEDAASLAGGRMGVAIMPESFARLSGQPMTAIDGVDLTRKVEIYGVSGRQRSAAASGLVKLLRAAD